MIKNILAEESQIIQVDY